VIGREALLGLQLLARGLGLGRAGWDAVVGHLEPCPGCGGRGVPYAAAPGAALDDGQLPCGVRCSNYGITYNSECEIFVAAPTALEAAAMWNDAALGFRPSAPPSISRGGSRNANRVGAAPRWNAITHEQRERIFLCHIAWVLANHPEWACANYHEWLFADRPAVNGAQSPIPDDIAACLFSGDAASRARQGETGTGRVPPGPREGPVVRAPASSWLAGCGSSDAASCCRDCGYPVVVTQSDGSLERDTDYWWYCSNKLCARHHPGEQTGDAERPAWADRGA